MLADKVVLKNLTNSSPMLVWEKATHHSSKSSFEERPQAFSGV
jgi:hypothetical protein